MFNDKLFVPFEMAVILKEKGFSPDCFAYYSLDKPDILVYEHYPANKNYIDSPLYDQVLRWLRNEHKLLIDISFNGSETFYVIVRKYEPFGEDLFTSYTEEVDGWPTYEEALPIAIYEALKFVK